MGLGVLILLFVAYQIWGTGLVEARAQNDLEAEFDSLIGGLEAPSDADARGTAPSAVERTPTPPARPVALAGGAVARIEIPAIGVDKVVVEGVERGDLRRGPGHYPGSPQPGQQGNAAIAGHRTTYGAPFFRLDELGPGDEILVTTMGGQFRYVVAGSEIVSPDRIDVLEDFGDDRLTLTTCNPRYSAAQRLIITAKLDPTSAAAEPVPVAAAPSAPPSAPRESIDDGFGVERGSLFPALAWGLATAIVAALTWLGGVRWRRWASYIVGAPVTLGVLFVFFENLNRLLPPSV